MEDGDDWPYRDHLSTMYLGGDIAGVVDDATMSALRNHAISGYDDEDDRMRPLVEEGIAAMVAFLTRASQIAVDTPFVDPSCPPGTLYRGLLNRCDVQETPPARIPPPLQECPPGTSCLQSVGGDVVGASTGGVGGTGGAGGGGGTGAIVR